MIQVKLYIDGELNTERVLCYTKKATLSFHNVWHSSRLHIILSNICRETDLDYVKYGAKREELCGLNSSVDLEVGNNKTEENALSFIKGSSLLTTSPVSLSYF